MATIYDPVPDAIDFLSRKSPLQRHAIVRILDADGPGLEVFRWLVRQRDCDRATAAMIFWELRGVASGQSPFGPAGRNTLISEIADRAVSGEFAGPDIAWDGNDIWSQLRLIGAPPLDGIAAVDPKAVATLSGPFGGAKPDPVQFAFFDHDYGDDDIFDSLWRVSPHYADAVDWLVGRSPECWARVADDLQTSHSEDILEWMKDHQDCASGERPEAPAILIEDFEFWCWRTNIGSLVKRPRDAAITQWQDALAWRRLHPPRPEPARAAAPSINDEAAAPSAVERFVYGGKFGGEKTQLDRAWRQFSVLSFLGMALFVAVGRWVSLKLGFALFLAWVAMISFYLGSVRMGGARRIVLWWVVVIVLTALGTVLL